MAMLRVDWEQCVAHVILSRPDKMNALSAEFVDEIVSAGQLLARRSDCRAVILSGEGAGFCSGMDLGGLVAATEGRAPATDFDTVVAAGRNVAQHAVLQWHSLPMPVIAAVHGVAFGGGLQLALGADIRIVHPETRLGFLEARWGLVPDMGAFVLLPELLRSDAMAELLFTGRTFDGSEAYHLGLATQLSDDPVEAAQALARKISALSPDAIRAAKRLLRLKGTHLEVLRAEAAEQCALFGRPNQREAVAAGMEKRAPQFK